MIYLDLRDYLPRGKDDVPMIEELLDGIVKRTWKARDRGAPGAGEILKLVRDDGAIVPFDGLDERIVHLAPLHARAFIRSLWSILPDAAAPHRRREGAKSGKLLISCRSHYFADVWSQNSMLAGEDREGIDKDKFPALCFLPFTEEQIRGYLAALLGSKESGDATFDLFGRIHILRDLAGRPYLLTLISTQIGALEKLAADGETINAARLYDLVVRSWLARDDGKHQLEPAHKRRMMEDLAAALWRDGQKSWKAAKLEEWLDGYLASNPILTSAYASKDRSVLKEDLRTATFILRPDTSAEEFRFAHTSLQEFFLASYLARARDEGRPQAFDLPMVSFETIDFLGQLLHLDKASRSPIGGVRKSSFDAVFAEVSVRAAMMGLRYWLAALDEGYPEPDPRRVVLTGADLSEWRIIGADRSRPLRLAGADLRGVSLDRARLQFVDLSAAHMENATVRQGLWIDVDAAKARCDGVDFSGMKWKGGRAHDLDAKRAASIQGAQWIDVDGARGAESIFVDTGRRRSTAQTGNSPTSLKLSLRPIARSRSSSRDGDSMPILSAQIGHTRTITSLALSPDGRTLATASVDLTLRLWDVTTGALRAALEGHSDWIRACAFAPDGESLVSASADCSLRIWHVATGSLRTILVGHTGSVLGCAFTPDGKVIVSVSVDGTLRHWDSSSGAERSAFEGLVPSELACALAPDGTSFISMLDDGGLRLWDASTGALRMDFGGRPNWVARCAISHDGKTVVSVSGDGMLCIWDTVTGASHLVHNGSELWVPACALDRQGKTVVSGSSDGTMRQWDVATGATKRVFDDHAGPVKECAFAPDDKTIVSASASGVLRLRDMATGVVRTVIDGATQGIRLCAFAPNGKTVVSVAAEGTLLLWDAASGALNTQILGPIGPVMACTFQPDGRTIMSVCADGTVRQWDVDDGEQRNVVNGNLGPTFACAFATDGTSVVSASADGTVQRWDAATGEVHFVLGGRSFGFWIWTIACDGRRIVFGSDDHVLRLADTATFAQSPTFVGHNGAVRAVAISPDGKTVLSASDDKTLRLWDVSSGALRIELTGHTNSVRACAFAPDGKRILSASADGTLRLWDAASGHELRVFAGHRGGIWSCAFAPDGGTIVSSGEDGTLRFWDATTGQLLRTHQHLPEQQWAVIDEVRQELIAASEEAWRFYAWREWDAAAGEIRILPAETFGAFPVVPDPAQTRRRRR